MIFFTSVVYNTKSQETQNKIFLQQLKTQSTNSGFYVTLSNLDPFFLLRGNFESGSEKFACLNANCATKKNPNKKKCMYMYIRTLSRF